MKEAAKIVNQIANGKEKRQKKKEKPRQPPNVVVLKQYVQNKYDNGDVYEGLYENGMKSGYGTMKFADGEVYEGNWVKDEMFGKGKVTCDDRVVKGTFKEDGSINGTITYKNGNVYKGDIDIFYAASGHGTMKYADGSEYEGEMDDDERHGKGFLKKRNGNEYRGEWAYNDIIKGTAKYKDGSVYEGEFLSNFERDGYGIMKYANGDVYNCKKEDMKLAIIEK
ncbi:hypothetical protein PIROE2DRAFT_37381 [Piromyces sp. E2]|nr:hypothetical protein PIROE2DRAFT_37381 [Piromyces sp. E2]|eukprot:OUM70332.1 hypothetical protein PIROE2DRAFT_37381 [Piromyces sp. E2]